MNTAEKNYRLLLEIEANRKFLLMAYQQNPKLLECAEMRIKQVLETHAHGADNNQSPVFSLGSSERGISLIELIMFIVIVGIALAGILLVMNTTTRGSANPLIYKQALAIAESMLEEVELMPFTFCDPDDAAAATANSLGECATQEGIGTEGGEGRYAAPQFDNVSDYHGFTMAPGAILDIAGNNTGVAGYTLNAIQITEVGGVLGLPASDALQIAVSVTGPGGVVVRVDGIRTRYSPRALP